MSKKASPKRSDASQAPKPRKGKKADAQAEVTATPPTEFAGTEATATEQPKRKKGTARKPREKKEGKMSALDDAAKVLHEAGKPLNCQEMIGQMAAAGYWTSPGGKTPASTLYSSILREMEVKGKESRFRKVSRGLFEATGV